MTTTTQRPLAPPRQEAASTPAPPRSYPLGWLRGLAAVCVVTFHAYQHNRSGPDLAWPWSGDAHQLMRGTELFVDMFFVLSGFVLWLPLARSALQGDTGRPGWVLLFRRMARLAPLYFVVVLVVWAWTNPTFPGHWQDLVLHLTFTQVYSDHFIFWTDGPAWSLAVEFHFYLLMALTVPLVHAAVRRTTRRGSRIAVTLVFPALLVAVGMTYLLWMTVWHPASPTDWSTLFSPASRAADFGIGTGLAVLTASGVRLGRPLRVLAVAAGLTALVWLVFHRPSSLTEEWWHPAYALAIAVALCSIVLHDGPWPRWLQARALTWVGGLGYGIYLIHEPVMRVLGDIGLLPSAQPGAVFVVTAVLVLVPTTLLAWLSSRTVERAGERLTATIDRGGRPRDYYAHLSQEETSA